MAATDALLAWARWWQRALQAVLGLIGGALAGGAAHAVDLPEDTAEAMIHVYDGGGVKATGPALLVRKSIADKVSVSGTYYVDMVSNASIDVVTTASPYKETRNEFGLGLDYAYRDSLITLSGTSSKEPDYDASSMSLDVSQEVFGGMTTVAFGFSRGSDKVRRHADEAFSDTAQHWKYRLGATQILSPTWLMSLNAEVVSDNGYLGSPYRVARVFGAAVPERNPRTRTSRAIKLGVTGNVVERTAIHADYRYFWDTWAIKAHTFDVGASRSFGDAWLADATLRYYSQQHALFYSDNAAFETTYVSRNRQLSSYNTVGLGAKVAYKLKSVPGKYEVKLNGAYELVRFSFKDFTDIRTGAAYTYNANVFQVFVSATY
ncbi:DUF3570 domain-containing protein [Ideonella sp. BN130291]|uniref:DUF3570 domain-containing protein n=1 Tax=Ideonella sp. BN130291 TaxID=3112940 RepID=UPI002E2565F5|nr:DUF3570 domain-containing protein [Ideonella sp. BN130291]